MICITYKINIFANEMNLKHVRHIACLLATLPLCLWSCSDQYNILGNSSIETYEGSTLYLRGITSANGVCVFDSADVVHGKFGFEGIIDTICMAQLCMGEHSLLPLVLETGNITISFSDAERIVKGGTLNDKLYKFLNENSRLQNELNEASHNIARMIMLGAPSSHYISIEKKSIALQEKLDKLWTSFIIGNFDNVLGPTYFQEYTSQYFYPVITPQIARILKRAPESFLNHPEVKLYIRDAQFNMQMMQGSFR